MTDDEATALLHDTLEVEMLRLLCAPGPTAHSDAGWPLLSKIAGEVWDAVPEAEKAERIRRANEFVEQHGEEIARRILVGVGEST